MGRQESQTYRAAPRWLKTVKSDLDPSLAYHTTERWLPAALSCLSFSWLCHYLLRLGRLVSSNGAIALGSALVEPRILSLRGSWLRASRLPANRSRWRAITHFLRAHALHIRDRTVSPKSTHTIAPTELTKGSRVLLAAFGTRSCLRHAKLPLSRSGLETAKEPSRRR